MAYSWQKLEDLFNQAITLKSEELVTFMENVGKDDQELKEVLTLMIDAALNDGHYMSALQHKMATAGTKREDLSLPIGSVLGKYKISERIGKGGMGEVYLANRAEDDLQQNVAIKVFNKSLKNKILQNKVLTEQQILANLNHPYIAQLYDAGIFDDNRPYIIMEYVEGLPIDKYCEQNILTLKERLTLFKKVCEAINYAHKNLILHQDIKPENILVSNDGYVKLLDFGIAKLISDHPQAGEKHFAGTPYYASPEQLQGKNISTTSDVYQLGILMYKLLTNNLPFEVKREDDFLTRAYDEPSLIPSSTIGKISGKSKLKGELDAIILKALKAEPNERYQSVMDLLADIERFEQNRPVSPLVSSKSYRFKKYLRRNVLTVLTVSAIVSSLSVAWVVSNNQYKEAENARKVAESTSDFLKDFFTSANPFLNSQRDYKQFSVYDFLEEKKETLFDNTNLPNSTHWEMLEIVYLTYKNLSIDEKAIEVGEKMLELATSANNRLWIAEANFYIGKAYAMDYLFDKSQPYFQNVYDELPLLEKENPVMAASLLKEVGLSIHLTGKYDSAELFYQNALATFEKHEVLNDEEAIRTYGNYSQLLRSTGRLDEALEMANMAVKRIEEIYLPDDLNLARNYGDRALIHLELTDYESSEKDFVKSLSITLQHLDSTNQTFEIMAGNYAIMLKLKGDAVKSNELNTYLYNHSLKTYGEKSMFTVYAQIPYAENLIQLGEVDLAAEISKSALTNAEQLLPEGHTILGMIYSLNARISLELGNSEHALKMAEKAKSIFENSLPAGHYRTELANLRIVAAKAGLDDSEIAELREKAQQFLSIKPLHNIYKKEAKSYLNERVSS